jgi:hypothetical protein
MGFLDGKTTQQIELEKKIKTLRDSGMNASADRMEQQLKRISKTTDEKIKPMTPQQLARQVKAQKAIR